MQTSSGTYVTRGRRLAGVLLGALAFALVLEIAVRASGAIDFPLYRLDAAVGYLPLPNQAGAFLNRNTWAFNDRSMPTPRPWAPRAMPNLLLIGNSIVAGGNPYDQREKLGSLMERSLADRYAVWPIAVGGWSTVNQLAYLERNPDVANAADFFVWSHTSGGLRAPAHWLGDETFPRRRPLWASAYVARRALARRFGNGVARFGMGEPYVAPETGATRDATARANLARFDRVLDALAHGTQDARRAAALSERAGTVRGSTRCGSGCPSIATSRLSRPRTDSCSWT